MNVCHLPGSHAYQHHLSRELRQRGVEIRDPVVPWGAYLPGIVDGLLDEGVDIFHVHWPEGLFRQPCRGLVRRAVRRLYLGLSGAQEEWGRWLYETHEALRRIHQAGRTIVWTQHNRYPHDRNAANAAAYRQLYECFAAAADGVIHHSIWGEAQVVGDYTWSSGAVRAVIPFGYFPDSADGRLDRPTARRRVGLDESAFVLLTVGRIEPRKRLDLLVRAVGSLDDPSCRLVLVGQGERASVETLRAQGGGRVIDTGPLSAEELAVYAHAADFLIFAPMEDQLTTGGPHLSESFLVPQLTTRTGYTEEILGDTALYFLPEVEDIRRAILNARECVADRGGAYAAMVEGLRARRRAHTWPVVADMTRDLYGRLTGSGRSGSAES